MAPRLTSASDGCGEVLRREAGLGAPRAHELAAAFAVGAVDFDHGLR